MAMSPMAKILNTEKACLSDADDSQEEDSETVVFNSDTHLQFISDNFCYFGCNFDDWVVC